MRRCQDFFRERAEEKERSGQAATDRDRVSSMRQYYDRLLQEAEIPGERSNFLKKPHQFDPNYLGPGCNLKKSVPRGAIPGGSSAGGRR